MGGVSLKERKLRRDFIALYKDLKGDPSQVGHSLSFQLKGDRIREESFKMCQESFRLDIREKIIL